MADNKWRLEGTLFDMYIIVRPCVHATTSKIYKAKIA
jgi:hypothetical protein